MSYCPPVAAFTPTGTGVTTTDVALLQMKYSNTMLPGCFEGDYSFPSVSDVLGQGPVSDIKRLEDVQRGQILRVYYRNEVNPTKNAARKKVAYTTDPCLPSVVPASCTVNVCGPQPTYPYKDIGLDETFTASAKWCLGNAQYTYETLSETFDNSKKAVAWQVNVDGWNKLMCELTTNPSATVGQDVSCFATHFVDGGSAILNGVKVLTDVLAYMKGIVHAMDLTIIADRQFEKDMVATGNVIHNYNNNGFQSNAIQAGKELVQGGFRTMPVLPQGLWGENILIADDSKYFYDTPGVNLNPFQNADGSKYYVLIAAKNMSVNGYFANQTAPIKVNGGINGCDANLEEALVQSWTTYNCVLQNCSYFVIAFDRAC